VRLSLPLALLLAAVPAGAATLSGADYAGGDLAPSNGDILSGVFTGVGQFSIPAGATVYIAAGVQLSVYAATITIAGTLDASGRGALGGAGGATGSAGQAGFGGGPSATGGGGAGASGKGGGGGAYGAAGGTGGGTGGGSAGAAYGSTGTAVSTPLSADDVYQGSGGGGGGGSGSTTGGSGAAGGGAIYLEASSVTLTGAVLLQGATAAAVTGGGLSNPGSGGGGSGGGLLIRALGDMTLSGADLDANGGSGGNVADPLSNTVYPGAGGGGGRVKVFSRSATFTNVTFSTAAGLPGGTGGFTSPIGTPKPAFGSTGTVTFGTIASAPSALAVASVYETSIAWSWTAAPSFGDAPSASRAYRLFPSTTSAPRGSPQLTALATVTSATETALSPNTTYYRVVTAFTDWGDGLPSNAVSTHTLAVAPTAATFSGVTATGLTLGWGAGSPANPSYTRYELQASTDSAFGGSLLDSASYGTSVSSSPAGLTPNTSYYVRVRALNLDGVPSAFAVSAATATAAAAPASAAASAVFVTSASFTWSRSSNPSDTPYEAEISTDNFFSLAASSSTLGASATFFSMTPGQQYYFRVRAVNRAGTPSAYTTAISTKSGSLSDTTPPSAPGRPAPDRTFSYDGTVVFRWGAASSSVGVLDYELLIGTFPGGNDAFNGTVSVASYTATGLATGRTYYAEVRARSNAGVLGPFSSVSDGVQVFNTASAGAIEKPYAWPNPFDPSRGPAQIGYHLDSPATVVLKIYTLQGRLLRRLDLGSAAAGNRVATWDGNDSSGSRAAPGGYIAVLERHYGGRTDSSRVKIAVLY
jgi:hypothetical protein